MIEQDVRLGTIAGIRVGANWSVLVVLWLIAWSLAGARFPEEYPGLPGSAYWAAGMGTALLFLASLLAHEMGHAIVARRAGAEVEGITLWLFGGVASIRGESTDPRAELRFTLVGPLISLGLGVGFLLLALALAAAGAPPLVAGASRWLGIINVVLALFNLVPAFPLDGGRVLRAYLWRRRGDRLGATRTAAAAGRAFGYALIALGLVEFALAFSLGGLWFVFLGWFLLGAARAEESTVLLRAALRDVRVRDIMSPDPVAVPPDTTIQAFIDDFAMHHRFTTFPVRDERGTVRGLITLSRVKQVPPERRSSTTVGEVACPLEEVPTAAPWEPAARLLERMSEERADGRALALVDGELAGIVSPRDVRRALELAGLREGRG
jgi:Zn-dependent protease